MCLVLCAGESYQPATLFTPSLHAKAQFVQAPEALPYQFCFFRIVHCSTCERPIYSVHLEGEIIACDTYGAQHGLTM